MWKEKSNKISRFFGFSTEANRNAFLSKVSEIEKAHSHSVEKTRLGPKAAVIKCCTHSSNSVTMKDHSISAAIDNAARSIWDTKIYKSKTAMEKEAASGAKLLKELWRGGKATAKGLGKATKWTGSKAYDHIFLPVKNNSLLGGQGNMTPGRAKDINRVFKDGVGADAFASSQTARQLGKRVRGDVAQDPISAANAASRSPLDVDYAGTFAKQLSWASNPWNALALRGRQPLRIAKNLAEQQGNAALAGSLQQRMNAIRRNRTIAGTAAIGAPIAYGAATQAQPQQQHPAWIQGIAGVPAGLADMFGAPNMANMMRENPYWTAGGSAATLALLAYLMMGRNNPQGY